MKQYFKRSTAWLLCLTLILGLFAGVPGAVLTKASATEQENVTVVEKNLLEGYNPAFEEYAIPNWTIEPGVAQSSEQSIGVWSLKINVKDASATSDAIALTAADYTYIASAMMYGSGRITVVFYDADGSVIGEESAEGATAEWSELKIEVDAPAGAAKAALKLSATTDEAVYFDDISLVRGTPQCGELLNGGFENWNAAATKPLSWEFSGSAYAQPVLETVEGRGNIVTFNRNDNMLYMRSDVVDVVGGMAYNFSIDTWMDVANEVQIYIQVWTADGKVNPITKHGWTYESIGTNFPTNEWKTLNIVAAMPADAIQARILITAPWQASGTIKFDNASVSGVVGGIENIDEGAPEKTGMPFGFTGNGSTIRAWVNTNADFIRNGSQSIAYNDNAWLYSNYISVVPGETYTSTLYIKTTAEAVASWKSVFVSLVYFYDANGTQLSNKQVNGTPKSDAWTEVVNTAVAPAGAAFAKVMTYSAGSCLCYADDFSFEQTSALAADQILANAGFETRERLSTSHSVGGGNAYARKWLLSADNDKHSVVYTDAAHGYSLNIQGRNVWTDFVPVTAGETYRFSIEMKGAGRLQVLLYYYKEDATSRTQQMKNDKGANYGKVITPDLTDEWTTYTHETVAPEGATKALVWLVSLDSSDKTAAGNAYADNVTLTKVCDHDFSSATVETAPTCTTTGTSVATCPECGAVGTIKVDATGHAWDDGVIDPDATCTEAGVKTYTCGNCGETKTEAVDAKGHTAAEAVKENEVAADCTNAGSYDLVVYCAKCDEELSRETVTVDATGHAWDAGVIDPDATCTESGVKTYTCGNCGETKTEAVDAKGHTPGEAVIENNVAADCDSTGSYDTVTYCSVCGAELSRVTTTVDALGHKYDAVVTAPTCTEKGYTTYTCSVCGDTYTDNEVAALGHTAAEAVKENDVAPDCDDAGSYDLVVYCSVCGGEISRQTVTVDALGHKYDAVVTAPTCTAEGYTTYTCSVCGDSYVADKVAATGHAWDDGVIDPDATCTEAGVKTYTCGNCGETKTEAVDATGHTPGEAVIENNVAPDCTNTGSYDTVTYCSVCGAELSRVTTTVDALGHKYDAVVTAPTCTAEGYTTYTCSVCGDSYTADAVAATGHQYGGLKVNSATCTEDGYIVITCNKGCGGSWDSRYDQEAKDYLAKYPFINVTAKGHTDGETVIENNVPADCTNSGSYDTVTYCTVCGAETGRVTTTVDALGHSYDSVVTAPTCTDKGYTTYTCLVCGDSYTADEVAASGHTSGAAVKENWVAPSNAADGSYDLVTYCTVCGAEVSREAVAVKMPNATVTVKDPMVLTPEEHGYMCWPSGDATVKRPLQIVMNFKANDTLDECLAGEFSKYLVDFYLTIEGLTDGSIIADDCYLAGNYGSFGWIVIPTDGLVIEDGICYPVVSAYDATLNYKDICKSVKDFTAALYVSDAILDANPNITVKLELKMTNPEDASDVMTVGEPAVYTFDDLKAGNPEDPAEDLKFTGTPALSFQEYIGIQLSIYSSLLEKFDEIYVEAVQMDPEKGAITTKLEGIPYYEGLLQVFDQQILSWSMAEEVTLTLYGVKDGVTYAGESYTESVETLALAMLEKYSGNATTCRVLVDMLNYGAAVQTSFNHNATLLPNTKIDAYASMGTSEIPGMTASATQSGEGAVNVAQFSISMQSKVELQALILTDLTGCTPKATLNGAEVALTLDTETYAAYGWTIVRLAAGAANLRDFYEFAVYDAEGNAVSPVYSISVEAYAKNQLGGTYNDVAVAMMRYGDAVAAYAAQ